MQGLGDHADELDLALVRGELDGLRHLVRAPLQARAGVGELRGGRVRPQPGEVGVERGEQAANLGQAFPQPRVCRGRASQETSAR